MITVAHALREAAARLVKTSDTARLDAELLMAAALEVSRSEMLLKARDLTVPEEFAFMLERRLRHEPVAYILERQEFFGREFLVNANVLIPRADSETLIGVALDRLMGAARILDLGTGSGALLLTLLAEREQTEGVGLDASLGAVAVAASNAATLGVSERAHILHGDWTVEGWRENLGRFDLVICNPPYVESDAKLDPDVGKFEPASALFAGEDGLDDYKILIPQLRALLHEDGCVVLEIGHEQADSVATIAHAAGFEAQLFRDLAHRPRALLLT
mgnify:CR=1 FL=1